jgi:DNA-binding PadR family transcriptional regulator
MTTVTPLIVLMALFKHETLTLPDLFLEKNLGASIRPQEVERALKLLEEQKFVSQLAGTDPVTYTITDNGIEECERRSLQEIEVFS